MSRANFMEGEETPPSATTRLKRPVLTEVSFFTGSGAPENWGIRYFFLDQKGGSKDFFKLKRGITYIF